MIRFVMDTANAFSRFQSTRCSLQVFLLDSMSSDHDHMDLNDIDLSSNLQNQADKRAHHNALERKRRDHIKGSFSDLRDVIPLLKGEKVTNPRAVTRVHSPFFRHLGLISSSRLLITFARLNRRINNDRNPLPIWNDRTPYLNFKVDRLVLLVFSIRRKTPLAGYSFSWPSRAYERDRSLRSTSRTSDEDRRRTDRERYSNDA